VFGYLMWFLSTLTARPRITEVTDSVLLFWLKHQLAQLHQHIDRVHESAATTAHRNQPTHLAQPHCHTIHRPNKQDTTAPPAPRPHYHH
jgi:hypothetical protein